MAGNGGAAALPVDLCPGLQAVVEIDGALPGLGSNPSYGAGCPNDYSQDDVKNYPTAASYTISRGSMVRIYVFACSDDGTSELDLTFDFKAGAEMTSELMPGAFGYSWTTADGQLSDGRDASVTVTETAKPVDYWFDVRSDPSAGVGHAYEGNFAIQIPGTQSAETTQLTGHFSVCHVANLPDETV